MTTTPPAPRIARAVSSAEASPCPRRTGNAPRRASSHPNGLRNSSALAMKRTRRRVERPTKKASRKLLWFAATIAGPSSGTCSAPVARIRNHERSPSDASARTTA